jgi:hypothetical protein
VKRNLILAMLVAALGAGEAQAAPLVVVEARGIGLTPGTTLDSEKPIVLKQGQHVTLISNTGATLKLDGPYDRTPTAGAGGGVDLSATLAALATQRQARLVEFGTTRGTGPSQLPDPWLVDASRSGNGCLLENRTPVFWRPETKTVSTLTIMPDDRSWKAQAQWAVGQDRLSINTDVPMRAGMTYIVDFNGTESAIAMILVPAMLTNDSMRAAWMAEKGCEAQAEALLTPGN